VSPFSTSRSASEMQEPSNIHHKSCTEEVTSTLLYLIKHRASLQQDASHIRHTNVFTLSKETHKNINLESKVFFFLPFGLSLCLVRVTGQEIDVRISTNRYIHSTGGPWDS